MEPAEAAAPRMLVGAPARVLHIGLRPAYWIACSQRASPRAHHGLLADTIPIAKFRGNLKNSFFLKGGTRRGVVLVAARDSICVVETHSVPDSHQN